MIDEVDANYYLVEAEVNAGTMAPGLTSSSTGSSSFNRLGSFVMPLVAAIGLHGFPAQERVLFVSRSSRSITSLSNVAWVIDSWNYSEDAVSLEQVRMLNELLSLSVDEGFTLDFPE